MDLYINTYLKNEIAHYVYYYIGWKELYHFDNIPDDVWLDIQYYFCQDNIFKQAMKAYWKKLDKSLFSKKEHLVDFINFLLHWSLVNIPKIMWSNKDFILCVAPYHEAMINYINDEWKSDPEFIMAHVKCNASALKHASDVLLHDETFIRRIVQRNGLALQYVPLQLRANRDIAYIAIQDTGVAFRHASPNLRKDRDFTMTMLNRTIIFACLIDDTLRDDYETMSMAVQRNGFSLKYASERVKANIRQYGFFKYVDLIDDTWKDELEIMSKVVLCNGLHLKYASERLKANKDLVRKAVNAHCGAFKYADTTLKTNFQFVIELITHRPHVMREIPYETYNNPYFFLFLVKNIDSLMETPTVEYIPRCGFFDDPVWMLRAIKYNPGIKKFIGEKLTSDHKFMAKISSYRVRWLLD